MNEALVENYCKKVKNGDKVYFLGDIAFHRKGLEIVKKLPGQKFLILGNHDQRFKKEFRDYGFIWSKDTFELNVSGGMRRGGYTFWLSHYAHLTWNKRYHGSLHLYGHSHGTLEKRPQMADVGVDCWDYTPVSLEEVVTYIKSVS